MDFVKFAAWYIPISITALLMVLLSNHADETRRTWAEFFRDQSLLSKHQELLRWLLGKIQEFYGDPWSFKAFDRSIILALFYPMLFFFFAYGYLEGSSDFQGIKLLPEDLSWKGLFVLGFIVGNAVLYAYLKWCIPNIFLLSEKIFPSFIADYIALIVAIFAAFLAIVGAGTVAGTVAGAVGFSADVITGILVGSIVGVAGVFLVDILIVGAGLIGVGIVVVGFAFVVIGTGAVVNGVSIGDEASLFFIVLLPIINGLLDWTSWGVSRHFLDQASSETSWFRIAKDIIFDAAFAILCLVVLCLFLYMGIDVFNKLLDTQINWHSLAKTTYVDPWGEGFMTSMMIMTTLIPTIIHIVLGLMAIIIHLVPSTQLVALLEVKEGKPTTNTDPFLAALWITFYPLTVIGILWYSIPFLFGVLRLDDFLYSIFK